MQSADLYSDTTYDSVVKQLIEIIRPNSVLDVGAGAGKYGHMVRAVLPHATLLGLEMGEDSITRHKLHEVYNEIVQEPAPALIEKMPLFTADLVILGDVIEHMRKSDGIDFLNWVTYRSKFSLIITPLAMPMARDPWYEGHNSVWSSSDFGWHDNWASHHVGWMQLFVLRGYLPNHQLALADVCNLVNASEHMVSCATVEGHVASEAVKLVHYEKERFFSLPQVTPGIDTRVHWRMR